jgi:predicted DNA-binding protein (MmcQ/YjbR family)
MARKKPSKRTKPATRRSASLKDLCRSLPGTTEDVKWGDDLVFSVGGKMYAAFDLDNEHELGFKCDEQEFLRLIQNDGIVPAPYAARFFWVKVQRRAALSAPELRRLIRRSYDLVLEKLPAKTRREIACHWPGLAGQ